MQIVIDIPDDVYDECKGDVFYPDTGGIVWEGVRNGTPLPKGHGRLMDYGYVVDAIDDWINSGEYEYSNATVYLRNRIRNAPTIVEADGGDAE